MGTTWRPARRAAVFSVAVLMVSACTPDTSSSDDASPDEAVPTGTVAVPPERQTPFCEAMIGLSDQLETDPPDDIEALIIETYLEIEDEVPPEIAPDFDAVLADLQGQPVPTVDTGSAPTSFPGDPVDSSVAPGTAVTDGTDGNDGNEGSLPIEGSDPSDEGHLPSEDPTARLAAYVDYTCGGSLNNPGPPATQPLDDIAPPTTDS